MKKLFVIIIVLNSIILAQNAGNAGYSFLKNGFGARNIALGDIGSVISNDLTALNYNPALLSLSDNEEIIFMHNSWIQDVNTEFIGAKLKLFGLPIAVALNTTSISDIEVRTQPGEAISKFNANYFSGSISTGFEIFEKTSFGFGLKYVYEGLLSDESNAWAIDLGLHYQGLIENLNIGLALRNLGSSDELRSAATKLPADFRFGVLYNFNEIIKDVVVIAGTEFQKYLNTDNSHLNFGAEITYNNFISLRTGYQTGFEAKSITAGVGFIWKVFNIDYSFVPFEYNLGSAHTISLKYSF